MEKDFLRTLSLIRSKDPRIYDKDSLFYQKHGIACSPIQSLVYPQCKNQKTNQAIQYCVLLHAAGKPEGAEEKVEEPMYLKDYERQQLLKRGAMAGVSDSEEEDKEVERASSM